MGLESPLCWVIHSGRTGAYQTFAGRGDLTPSTPYSELEARRRGTEPEGRWNTRASDTPAGRFQMKLLIGFLVVPA